MSDSTPPTAEPTAKDRIATLLEQKYGDRIYTVEDGVVWISGMNTNCPHVARMMKDAITEHLDIQTSTVYDDGAPWFGGVQFNYYP